MSQDWTRYVIADPAHQGMPVALFEHPAGWLADSRVTWNLHQKQSPVMVHAFAATPDKSLACEFLPTQGYSWPPAPMTMPGQNADGIIQMQPPAPVEAMTRLIVPGMRGRCQNLQVLSANAVEVAAPSDPRAPQAQARAFKATARISFEFNGETRHEEFRARQIVVVMPPMGWGMPAMTFWQLAEVRCFSTNGDGLDAAIPIFDRMEASWQENPQWKALLQQRVSGMLAQANQATNQLLEQGWQQVRANGQASREFMARNQAYVDAQQRRVDAMENPIWTQTSSTFSAAEMVGTGAGSDYTSHNQFVDAMREEQTVHNPVNSANEKISNHYDHVWRDHDGNLQGSNDPNFDPNRGSDREWVQATVKRPGRD